VRQDAIKEGLRTVDALELLASLIDMVPAQRYGAPAIASVICDVLAPDVIVSKRLRRFRIMMPVLTKPTHDAGFFSSS
jgi:hypothetical protein